MNTNPAKYPVITMATVRSWRSAGIRLTLKRVPGGYIVRTY